MAEKQYTEVNSQLIQESSSMLIGEGNMLGETVNPNNIPGFKQTTNFRPNYASQQSNKKKTRTLIFEILRDDTLFLL